MGGFTIQTTRHGRLHTYRMTPEGFMWLVKFANSIPVRESLNPPSAKHSVWKRLFSNPRVAIRYLHRSREPTLQEMLLEEAKKANLIGFKQSNLSCEQNPFEKKDINDKGKADSISKALVGGQVLWMLLQCLGRKVDGLPITLLEIHVAIQIAYSVIVYALWWHKPFDVSVPIPITINEHVWEQLTTQKSPAAERLERSETAGTATRGKPMSANSEIEEATNESMICLFVCNHIAFGRWRPWHIPYIFPPRFFRNIKEQKQSRESSSPKQKQPPKNNINFYTPPSLDSS